MRSLKIADLSIEWLRASKHGWPAEDVIETWPPRALAISESASLMMRFNDENTYLEWMISRGNPNERKARRIYLGGFARGVHSESFYKRLEEDCDGIIDLRVMERDDESKTLLRVRSLKGQPHDARWHEIKIKPNGEAALTA
jgi:KaiC/GvpD/RAD55 family RecA-like ATPase